MDVVCPEFVFDGRFVLNLYMFVKYFHWLVYYTCWPKSASCQIVDSPVACESSLACRHLQSCALDKRWPALNEWNFIWVQVYTGICCFIYWKAKWNKHEDKQGSEHRDEMRIRSLCTSVSGGGIYCLRPWQRAKTHTVTGSKSAHHQIYRHQFCWGFARCCPSTG